MLHVDHSRHAQSPGSSLPGTRVAAHGKRAAPLLARFLLTAQGAGASGLFSQPRVRHGAEEDGIAEVFYSSLGMYPTTMHLNLSGKHLLHAQFRPTKKNKNCSKS